MEEETKPLIESQELVQLNSIKQELALLKHKDVTNIMSALKILNGKIDKLSANQEQSEAIEKIAEAFAKAVGSSKPLKESGAGNSGKYSTFDDYQDSYEKALSVNGLSITFLPQMMPSGQMILVTKLLHSSGQWLRSVLPLDVSDNSNSRQNEDQKLGSTISYMKRYAYAAMMASA